MDKREGSQKGPSELEKKTWKKGGRPFKEGWHPLNLDYFKEARLFFTKDRATLTFFAGSEVASIHYDQKRNEIFYRGHNVKNMTLTQEQWLSLQMFSDYLEKEGCDSDLRESYQRCLASVLPRR